VLIHGDQAILPGTELLLTPGHTPGLQSVAVTTNQRIVVLTLNCAHVHQNFEIGLPSSLIFDLPGWMIAYPEAWREATGNLGLLFSGHDRVIVFSYPRIAEGANALGVRGGQT
jgi:glyoxylase-like metal-dependent hydrolase (beta-lactamase superfamily II)